MSSDDSIHSVVVPLKALSRVQREAWTELATSAIVPNPFFEVPIQDTSSRYLKPERPPFLVLVSRGETLLGVLPLRIDTPGLGPLSLKIGNSRSRGAGYAIGLGAPLFRVGESDTAAAGVIAALCQWSGHGGPSVIVLDWLDYDEGGVGCALRRAALNRGLIWYERASWERPTLDRGEQGLSLGWTMGRESLRQLRKRRRRLERDLGTEVRLIDRSDTGAVEEFLRLEASGWKGRESEGHAYLRDGQIAGWFRTTCAELAERGQLHLLCLQADERILAIQCCVISGSVAFFFRVGHDDTLRQYGLGVLVQYLGVEHLDNLGISVVDSCADRGNEFLAGLYPNRRQLSTCVVATGGRWSRMVVRGLPVVLNAREETRAFLTRRFGERKRPKVKHVPLEEAKTQR